MQKRHYLLLIVFLVTGFLTVHAQDTPSPTFSFTHQRADGNRVVDGIGTFPQVRQQTVALNDTPLWLTGILVDDEPVWFVELADGTVQQLALDGSLTTIATLAPGQPFVANRQGVTANPVDASIYTHAHPLGEGKVVFIASDGDLVLAQNGTELARQSIQAIPDARIVVNANGLGAVYSDVSGRYAHGVVGDDVEGTVLTIFEADTLEIQAEVILPDNDVFEGIMPFWADIDEDGEANELVATVSNARDGAQVRAYRANGELLAQGPAIGQGYRWRHQLAFGAFGPNGENEIVSVLTPHIGGWVEYYRYQDGQLNIVTSQSGYTSHMIGSANLDMAVAGDFNGDGQLEIVVADQTRQTISGLQRTESGVEVMWTLNLNGQLITNMSALALADGSLALAVGTTNNELLIWYSVS